MIHDLSYAFMDLPHNALLALVPASSGVRAALAAQRQTLGALAGLALSGAFAVVLLADDVAQAPQALQILAAGLSIASFVVVLICARLLAPFELVAADQIGAARSPRQRIAAVAQSRGFRLVLALAFVGHMAVPAFSKCAAFLEARYGAPVAGGPLIAMTLAHAGSSFAWARLAERVGKHLGLVLAFAVLAICGAGLFAAFIFAPGAYLLLAAGAVIGVGTGGVFTLLWALAPDVIDAARTENDTRLQAIAFGAFTFTNKVALGLCALAVGVLMDFAPSHGEVWAAFLLPVLGSLLCVALLLAGPRHERSHVIWKRRRALRGPNRARS